MEKQGGWANNQGRTLEHVIKSAMEQKGFRCISYKQWNPDAMEAAGDLLLTDVPYETIYGHPGRTEFKIVSQKYGEYRIECKWQQSSGSVDEKFPYLYLNCVEKMPEKNIIIVIDGNGAKPGAVQWLKQAAASKLYTGEANRDKRIAVMSLAEFVVWANQTFR